MPVQRRRLFVFAVLFAAAVIADAAKFLIAGKPTVVNWESFAHSAWVVSAAVILFISVRFEIVRRVAFWVYLAVFVAAYANIYFPFSATLTYFCMIFNLALVAVYFFTK